MRRSTIGLALGTALLCGSGLLAATSAAAATPAPTKVTVVRPVTASGHAAPGYSVTSIKGAGPVDCSYPQASPAALQNNIIFCGPSAADALACWRSAAPKHVLCLFDGPSKRLASYPTSGKIAKTTKPKHPRPLSLTLTNGTYCGLRDGGAGARLTQHPSWVATYYCTGGQSVWAPENASGVNRTHRSWTVQIANQDGRQKVHTAHVARAWFVATHA